MAALASTSRPDQPLTIDSIAVQADRLVLRVSLAADAPRFMDASLAARLTGWHIDIKSASFAGGPHVTENILIDEEDDLEDETGLCAYVAEDGTRCRNHAREGSRYCGVHADLDES